MAEQEQQTTQTAPAADSQEDGDNKKKTWIIIGVVVLVLIIIGAVYYLATSKNSPIANIFVSVSPTDSPTPVATQTPVSTVTISGTVALKGSAPSGSTFAIGAKSSEDNSFKPVVTGLPAKDGTTWSWNQAEEGVKYEIEAFLVSSKKDDLLSQSQIESVVAPAKDVDLAIAYTTLPPPPPNSLRVDCLDKDPSTNLWQVNITYNINNPNSEAQQYRVGAGTSKTGDLLVDEIIQPKSPDVTQDLKTDYIFTENVTYFAAYAYAVCANCDEFSPPSDWSQYVCTADDLNKPSPSPSPALTPSPTATPAQ